MSPTRERRPHPIYTGCHGRLRATNPIETNKNSPILILLLSTLILLLPTPNSALTLIYCSSFVPMKIEGTLENSPTLILPLSTLILLLPTPNSTLTLICCSSFILMVIEGILVGLTDTRTHQGTPALTGSLPGRSSLDSSRRSVKTGLTIFLYRSDRPVDPEAGQAHLRPAHEQVLRCVTRSHAFWQLRWGRSISVFIAKINSWQYGV
jgi:hypothetical protein